MSLLAQFRAAWVSSNAQLRAAWAEPMAPIPTISAPNAQVDNLDTGKVYYSKTATLDPAASVTKLMTARLVMMYRPTLTDLAETTTITSADIADGTSYNLQAGDVVSLYALLVNALFPSDNSSCSALARVVGLEMLGGSGTESQAKNRFVAEMNAEADSLGMSNETVFVNPHGLGENYMSSHDANILIGSLRDNAILLGIWASESIDIHFTRSGVVQTRTLTTPNAFFDYPGVYGFKGGTLTKTNLALLWRAPSGDKIALTVIGSPDATQRYNDMKALLDQLPIDYPELAQSAFRPFFARNYNTLIA